ncbi:MAG TPA: sugar ABC transporter permease [Actinokineospora sp.]|nr:sugar ABC transporter permease [Actinokineospora sp.]
MTTTRPEMSVAASVRRPVRRASARGARHKARWLLLTPFYALFLFVFLLPLGYALVESLFTEKKSGLGIGGERVFAGLANYVTAVQHTDLLGGVGRVLLFGLVQVPVMLLVALGLALAVDALTGTFPKFARLAAFLPYAVPGVIAAILWAFLYMRGTSPFVAFFATVGISVDFLGDDLVLWSIANIVTWTWTGYNMLVIYSALTGIPRELYEAAALDGAGAWRIAMSIKVPLVAPALVLTTFFSIVGTVQLYAEPTVLKSYSRSITGGYTPNMAVQDVAFGLNNYGVAAAMAVLLALGTFVVSFGFLRLAKAMTTRKAAS